MPVRATRSHQKTCRATSFGHTLGAVRSRESQTLSVTWSNPTLLPAEHPGLTISLPAGNELRKNGHTEKDEWCGVVVAEEGVARSGRREVAGSVRSQPSAEILFLPSVPSRRKLGGWLELWPRQL
jgi:hypothetical protein